MTCELCSIILPQSPIQPCADNLSYPLCSFKKYYKNLYLVFTPSHFLYIFQSFSANPAPKITFFQTVQKKKRRKKRHINHLWSVTQSTEGLGVTRWAGLQRWEVESRPDRQMEESGQDLKDEEGDEGWSWLGAVTVWDMDDPPHQCDRGP